MVSEKRLVVDTSMIRAGANAVSTARSCVDDVPDVLTRTAAAVEAAAAGSATGSAWRRLALHCARSADDEIDTLRTYRDGLLRAAEFFDDTERAISAAAGHGKRD